MVKPPPPTAGDASYSDKGHKISTRTTNLDEPWPSIHQDLVTCLRRFALHFLVFSPAVCAQ